MKSLFSKHYSITPSDDTVFSIPSLLDDIEKTRIALDIAYAGFDNAVNEDMIDCYIYEINALLKRYKHLTELAAAEDKNVPVKKASFLSGLSKALRPAIQNPFPLR